MSRHSRRPSSSSSSTSSSSSSSSSTSSSSSSSSSSSHSTHRREKGRSRRKKSSSKEGRVREGRRSGHSIDRKESKRSNELSGHKDKGRERRREWRSKSPDNRKQRHRSKSLDSRRHRHRSKSLSRRERSRSRSKERYRKEYRSKEKDSKVKKSESPSHKDIPKKFSSDYRESSVEEFKRKNSTKKSYSKRDDYRESSVEEFKRKNSTKKSDSKRDDYRESSVEEFKRKNNTKKSDSKREDDDGKKKEKSKPQKVSDDAPSNDLVIPNDDLLIKEKKSDFKSDVDKTQSLSPNKIEKVEEYEKEHTKSDKNNKKNKDHSKNEDYEYSEKKKKSTKSKRKHSSSPETNIDEDKDKNDLEENLNYSKEKQPKDSKSKRKESISEEANIDELQKMKEQLQRELDLEREEEEKVSSTTQSKDSDKRKRYKKTKDEEETRQNHGKRKLESEDGTEDESTIQKAKQIKTSDTYWNKYADKLGIQIDDPKFEKRNRETEKSQKDGERKVKETKIDSLSLNKAPSGNELIKKPVLDPLSTRAGGAYIPPAKLKMMQEQITDKSSQAFQRLSWEALKKSINGLVNKINVSNIKILVRELFKENIIRGRGVLCRSLMQAQAFSPTFTHVYAALVAVINSKFPQIGELLLHRLVLQFRRGVKRNDKNSCMASCKFLAHLINQQVAHEVVALEILTMLLEKAKDIMDETPTGEKSRQSSVELSITFLKDCGMKLSELTPKGLMIIMETLRNILHEGKLDARYKYMIEVLMAIQKENFKDFPSVVDELDLVEEGEQFTHVIELDGKLTTDDILNVFKLDPNYEENEKKYQDLKASILGESDDDDGDDDSGPEGDTEDSDSKDEESDNEEKKDEEGKPILDRTESNLIAFRRTVYLTIQSSLDVDECAHKLLKGEIKPGWEEELCNMIIDCCAQQRTYIKFYGLLAQRFCMINKIYQEPFENLFKDAFETCHRLEIEKLRNVAKLFAHLFFSDAISWEVMSCIHLNQDETTSSSRVFLKILFEELANFMGLCKLNERLREPTLSHAFDGLLPRDNPVNTRFAINFFTTIGLGGLTDDLREFLRSQPKPTAVVAPVPHTKKESGSSSSGTSSSSTSSSSDSSSSSGSSSSSSSSSSDSESDSSSGSSSSNDSSSSSKDSSGGSSSNETSSSSSESSSSDESVSKERKSRKRKRPKSSSNSAREKGPKRKPKKREGKSLPSSESKKRKYDNHYSKRRTSKAQ